jgi:hypothetical protein
MRALEPVPAVAAASRKRAVDIGATFSQLRAVVGEAGIDGRTKAARTREPATAQAAKLRRRDTSESLNSSMAAGEVNCHPP